MKICTRCGEEKPATPEFFARCARARDGLQWSCKDCVRKRRGSKKRLSPEECFWHHVNKNGPAYKDLGLCWEWTACSRNGKSYGAFGANGKTVLAHRFSWELHFGPIPEGLKVCHHCDNPKCVNPSHLFLGTHQDNMDDKVAKVRQAKGEKHGNVKLSEDEVREIRARRAKGEALQSIARDHGIHISTVSRIARVETWALVS